MARLSSSSQGVTKTIDPRSAGVAGEVKQYTGTSAPSGYLKLSPNSDTTITNCQTVYPQLWNRADSSWRSGSDLVIPAGVGTEHYPSYNDSEVSVTGNNNWVTSKAYLKPYRDGSGAIRLHGFIEGDSDSVTGELVYVDSIIYTNTESGSSSVNNATIGTEIRCNAGTNLLVLRASSQQTAWAVNFDFQLNSWPSWATKDAESTPIIKLYDDSTTAVSVSVAEATADTAGVVRKNRSQTKIVNSNVTTDITFMTFNNLVVGKLYRIDLNLGFQLNIGGSDSNVLCELYHDGVNIADFPAQTGGTNGVGRRISDSFTFEAVATTLELRTLSASNNAYLSAEGTSGGSRASRATIIELNNTVETADFT